MKTKLTGSLAIALTLTMLGYMSLSLKSANAQGAGKISTPAKSEPVKTAAAQAVVAPDGAAKALAPDGAGKTFVAPPVEAVVPDAVVAKAKKGGCCSGKDEAAK
jgi:hypothetical protein